MATSRRARVVCIIIAAVLAAGLVAVVGIMQVGPRSKYDVAGMLACDPRILPMSLRLWGLSYEQGVPYGFWEAAGVAADGGERPFEAIMFAGVTPDLMRAGRAPDQATFSIQYASLVSEEEALAMGDDLLTRAGLSGHLYEERIESKKFESVQLIRAGRVADAGPAAYWQLTISIDESLGYSTYLLTAYAEQAAPAELAERLGA